MTTVFDIASEMIERSGGSIETVKLQKLCFYTFGWYAHLTGEPLFGETFYAMPKGPVVGELLSAHAGQRTADVEMIEAQRDAREDDREQLDAYKEALVDAVWEVYGRKSSWELVDLTHEESIWTDAWDARREDSRRSDLPRQDIVAYFLDRTPKPSEPLELPPAMISRESPARLADIETAAQAHQPFIEAARAYRYAS